MASDGFRWLLSALDGFASQEVLKDIMLRRHESSLQLSGDKSAEEEAALAQAAGEMGGKSAARAIEKVCDARARLGLSHHRPSSHRHRARRDMRPP